MSAPGSVVPASHRGPLGPTRVRGPRAPGSAARASWLATVAMLCCLCGDRPIAAQVDRVGAGAVGLAAGAVAGVWTTTSIYVAKARTGAYLFSPNDILRVRWETIPVGAFPIAGAIVGASSPYTLGQIAIWGGLGLLAGAGAGLLTAQLVRGTSEARWAGGIIGSGVGLLVGIVIGALRSGGDDETAPSVSVVIPIRIGGDS